MSHHHVELIMPPTPSFDIEGRVHQILHPLSQGRAEAGDYLYDWLTIGGRFAGTKVYRRCDPERLRQFQEELRGEAFNSDTTGSSWMGTMWWSFGDIPKIDALWRKWFPEEDVGKYPLSPEYPAGDGDVCRVDRLPDNLTADAVVVANQDDKVVFRLETVIWDSTGRQFQRTDFDGTVRKALRRCRAGGVEPANDWLAVTLDCHNWAQRA